MWHTEYCLTKWEAGGDAIAFGYVVIILQNRIDANHHPYRHAICAFDYKICRDGYETPHVCSWE